MNLEEAIMLKTNLERIQRDIEELAKFTCVEGIGCTRYNPLLRLHSLGGNHHRAGGR